MTSGLRGRTAVITGATGGIGAAIIKRLATEGVRLGLIYFRNSSRANQLVASLRTNGVEVTAVSADLTDPTQAAAAFERISDKLGVIELLVHAAGFSSVEPADSVTWECWRTSLSVNLDAAFNAIYVAKDAMLAQRFGRVVALSSISGLRERRDQVPYSVAKAGVIALIRSCAEAWASYNIRLNTICPGLIDTDRLSDFQTDFRERVIAAIPMGRLGEPSEIAAATRFLLSEESSYITGQALVVSGGRVMLPG